MRALQFALAVLLAAPAGGLALVGYLWYRHAPRLYAQWLFPAGRLHAGLVRFGVAAGCIAFGGVLLALALALGTGSVSHSGVVVSPQCRFRTAATGLLITAVAAFSAAGVGYVSGER